MKIRETVMSVSLFETNGLDSNKICRSLRREDREKRWMLVHGSLQ